MSDEINEEIKKYILMSIGAAAYTAEKSKAIIDELTRKGQITVDQGKVLNEELRHNVKENLKKSVTINVNEQKSSESIIAELNKLSSDDRNAIRAKLDEIDNSEKNNPIDSDNHK